jgi:hypothetical protein
MDVFEANKRLTQGFYFKLLALSRSGLRPQNVQPNVQPNVPPNSSTPFCSRLNAASIRSSGPFTPRSIS